LRSGQWSTRGRTASRENYPYPTLDSTALTGIAGEFVSFVEPETEADPTALLIQFLGAAGSAMGRAAHYEVEATHHYSNIFAVGAGRTAAGRKGTSWAHVKAAMTGCDDWAKNCIKSGLSSGEGVIHTVRDPVTRQDPIKEKGRHTGEYDTVQSDPGIRDKRLLIFAPEFSQALKVAARESSILSEAIRQAWDTDDLHILNKNSPEQATGAHISIIAHISKFELLSLLAETDCANGFFNRFLWYCVRRSKELPEGGLVDSAKLEGFIHKIATAIAKAKSLSRLHW
jgi:hypothetical protein